MFDDLPPDLERLNTLRVWHAMWLHASTTRSPPCSSGQRNRNAASATGPRKPDWIVQLGIGAGHPPLQVHAGDCYAAGTRRRAIDRDEARRLLASGLPACTHCQPDVELRILD
ncbi:DUF6233 domain-containing protein [Streptomyces bluensis]|uniref:DUF6233 domain-containing protein n=1 Tax=Streptomyces bluensis TaxID=33897 RepID=A0ABW6UW87_9ACTN